ncbi:MAG: DEAD/DEAH box helicase [Thaumarchaeota archaeon]|nr:DEAD/DEAH box helicase [Nitrososphaerota archaeon]
MCGRIYSIIEKNHSLDSRGTDEYWQAPESLKPYISYLKDAKKHCKETRITFKWKEHNKTSKNKSKQNKQQRTKNKSKQNKQQPAKQESTNNVWVSIDDIDDTIKQRILDEPDNTTLFEYDVDSKFRYNDRIKITSTNTNKMLICLEHKPKTKHLLVAPNTSQISKQIDAMIKLKNKPISEYVPLRRLFTKRDESSWPDVQRSEINRWFILDKNRVGASQQMEFVEKALGTQDFALLEGPPGSGKTATLCELVMQLVSSGKRVLFCASTHVAVDNLLERLEPLALKDDLIPLRIGDSPKMSDSTAKFRYEEFTKTVKDNIYRQLSELKNKNRAQNMLYDVIQQDDILERMVRDCANLVCGTTIGILQHPDIKNGTIDLFDYLILDEASKTTFHEFLVSAIHATKWIVVGDIKQLVPHTDQAEIAAHLKPLVNGPVGDACVDAFLVHNQKRTIIVATENDTVKTAYHEQCNKLKVDIQHAGPIKRDQIMLDTPKALANIDPQDSNMLIRGFDDICTEARKKKDGEKKVKIWRYVNRNKSQKPVWAEEMAWRISRHTTTGMLDSTAKRLATETEELMPTSNYNQVNDGINNVKKYALPSILEILQQGFDLGDESDKADTTMRNGLPEKSLHARHVLLTYQHRMHPDIAEFSKKHMYDSKALLTPDHMKSERSWEYNVYRSRTVWIDIHGKSSRGKIGTSYRNIEEANQAIQELKKFCEFALKHKKKDTKPWTVAILSFYTGQIAEMRPLIQKFTGQYNAHSFKYTRNGKPVVSIDLRTVDSFQGHEADIVILSMVRGGVKSNPFLDNPNRINVAVTRAKYQLVVIGNKQAMPRDDSLRYVLADMLGQVAMK